MALTDILKKYEYARIGADAVKAEDFASAKSSLDKLVDGLSLDEDSRIIYDSARDTPETLAKILDKFNKKYREAYDKASVTDFWKLYSGVLDDNEKRVYRAGIERYEGKKLKDIEKEFKEKRKTLGRALNGEIKLSEQEISRIKSDIRDYSEVLGIIRSIEQMRYADLSLEVAKKANKDARKNAKKQLKGLIGAE